MLGITVMNYEDFQSGISFERVTEDIASRILKIITNFPFLKFVWSKTGVGFMLTLITLFRILTEEFLNHIY